MRCEGGRAIWKTSGGVKSPRGVPSTGTSALIGTCPDAGEMQARCRRDAGEMQARCRRDAGEI